MVLVVDLEHLALDLWISSIGSVASSQCDDSLLKSRSTRECGGCAMAFGTSVFYNGQRDSTLSCHLAT